MVRELAGSDQLRGIETGVTVDRGELPAEVVTEVDALVGDGVAVVRSYTTNAIRTDSAYFYVTEALPDQWHGDDEMHNG